MTDNRRRALAWLSMGILPIVAGIAYAISTHSHSAINAPIDTAWVVGILMGIVFAIPGVVGTFLSYAIFGRRAWPRVAKMLLSALVIGFTPTLFWINGFARMHAGTWLPADWSAFPETLLLISAAYLPVCIIFWCLVPQRDRTMPNPTTSAS